MPRSRRLNINGAIYHVITRGLNRCAIFKSNKDRNAFLIRLSDGLSKTGTSCYAWALMKNHIHLLLQPSTQPLSKLMSKVLTSYAMYFNYQHKRCGRLFQNRYKSILCQEDAYLLELVRYIHLNPARIGKISTLIELSKYAWTGHSAIVGKIPRKWQSVNKTLLLFDNYRKKAKKKYNQYILDGWKRGKREDLSGGGLKRSLGGWKDIQIVKKTKDYWPGDERILGDEYFVKAIIDQSEEKLSNITQKIREGWNLEMLVGKVCQMLDVPVENLTKKGRANNLSQAKKLIAYWGYTELGVKGVELCRRFSIKPPSLTQAIAKGEKLVKEEGYSLKNLKLIN